MHARGHRLVDEDVHGPVPTEARRCDRVRQRSDAADAEGQFVVGVSPGALLRATHVRGNRSVFFLRQSSAGLDADRSGAPRETHEGIVTIRRHRPLREDPDGGEAGNRDERSECPDPQPTHDFSKSR